MMILLVEDEALIAMELEAILSDAGHTVRGPASTAARAREIAEHTQPTLALVDINLRDGHGAGIGLARDLLSRWAIPSVFVSGQRAEAWAHRATALGYIAKPYRQETILRSVAVAEHIIEARPPPLPEVPAGLELFKSTLS